MASPSSSPVSPKVILPESIETVVSALVWRVSSVTAFSVETTSISESEATNVVLPAANGPVTTTLTEVTSMGGALYLEVFDAGDEPEDEGLVEPGGPGRGDLDLFGFH